MLTEEQRARIHTEPVAPIVLSPDDHDDGDRGVQRRPVDAGTVADLGTRRADPASTRERTSSQGRRWRRWRRLTSPRRSPRIRRRRPRCRTPRALPCSTSSSSRTMRSPAAISIRRGRTPRRPAADREAAIEQMVALGVDSTTIDAIREGRPVPPVPGVIRAPIAGDGGGEADQPRRS